MRRSFHPDVIVVFNEYSFTSSALTAYCESNGIEHIDVMHGEKLYYIRDSFFRFTHTYVWEYYYEQLFLKLRAASDQFVASLPPFMRIVPEEHSDNSQYADIKYYLANYTEEELLGIISSLSQARNNGLSVKFRPHPRYSNVELLKKYISSEEIEFPTEVDILTSVSNLRYAVGVYTTVLYQAYRAGKDVVIDDINFPNNFKLLSDMQYILMNKPIEHLSSIQFQ